MAEWRFFLVFQYEHRMKARSDTLQGIAERLREEEQTARRYLDMYGLEVVQVELLYSFINKKTSRHTRLLLGVYDMVSKLHGMEDSELETQEKGESEPHETEE